MVGDDKIERIDHPKWYGGASNPFEVIKVIEDWNLGFKAGNALKYLYRAGRKPGDEAIESLQKARWYLVRLDGLTKQRGEFVDHIIMHVAGGAAPLRLSAFHVIGEERKSGVDSLDRLIELEEVVKAWEVEDALAEAITAIFEANWSAAVEAVDELIAEGTA